MNKEGSLGREGGIIKGPKHLLGVMDIFIICIGSSLPTAPKVLETWTCGFTAFHRNSLIGAVV